MVRCCVVMRFIYCELCCGEVFVVNCVVVRCFVVCCGEVYLLRVVLW